MRPLLFIATFMLFCSGIFGQSYISGKVVSAETGEAIAFATVKTSPDSETLTNIQGDFELMAGPKSRNFTISYIGYEPKKVSIDPSIVFYRISLNALRAPTAEITQAEIGTANHLITRAIENKNFNDPELALNAYTYKSYTKLLIDKQRNLQGNVLDPTHVATNLPASPFRSFLSEIASHHSYKNPEYKKEVVTGFSTAGFEEPVYEVLRLNIDPPSVYGDDYPYYGTSYSGPLGKNALNNYTYKILDTVNTAGRPGYVIYFKPRKEGRIPGWEGLFYLDTISLAVQKAKLQLTRAINMEIDYSFDYREKENIWFPSQQRVILKPGTGGDDIAIFGGSISLGTVQRKVSILNFVLNTGEIEDNLALTSTSTFYDVVVNEPVEFERYTAAVKVLGDAHEKEESFWQKQRKEPLTPEDELTAYKVQAEIQSKDILRKVEVLDAILTGFYPVGFWNFDLSNFIKYNNYEGLRLGAGGETNTNFSENFRIAGYLVYGLKDQAFKYGFGGGALLHGRTGTWLNLNYRQDIAEVASHTYIKAINEFSIFEPRVVNISYYYAFKTLESSLEHRLTPRLDAEFLFSRSDISQIREYAFLSKGERYRNYTITEAKFGFLWRPFSKFISTPNNHYIYDKSYPVVTGQITKSFDGTLGGNFDFTKLGLRAEYKHNRQNLSVTQITVEGNYGVGELPLTHAFHAFPNNPNRPEILDRFSVAGNLSFETMYFDEFFSDRQASVHLRHQLPPLNISNFINPEVVLISRHVIGDFNNKEAHQNIEFNTLEHVYSEAGLELNKILFGLGLSTAYRYGAYHLPTFKENFSFKFTFHLNI